MRFLNKFKRNDTQKMAKRAIREGKASPTIPYAIEEGGEMLEKLREMISKMDDAEKTSLKEGLTKFREMLESDMEIKEQNMHPLVKNLRAQVILGAVCGLMGGSISLDPVHALGSGALGAVTMPAIIRWATRADRKERKEVAGKIAVVEKLFAL